MTRWSARIRVYKLADRGAAHHSVLHFFIIVLLLSVCCIPGSAAAGATAPGITTFGISNHPGILWRSAQIEGDRIVWAERTSSGSSVDNIYLYNITTGTETLISSLLQDGTPKNASMWGEHPVAVSGNRVVWTTDMGIRMFDIPTQKKSMLVENSGDYTSHLIFRYPGISGDTIVWTERLAGGPPAPDIIAYNLTTGKKTVVSHGAWDKTGVRIAGSRVVWEDYRKGGIDRDIYLYDLETGQELVICNASAPQSDPQILKNRVVWSDHRDGNWDVYLYDLETETETKIAGGASGQEAADISGDRIVWMEWPSLFSSGPDDGNNRLMMYDLATKKEYQVQKDIPGMFAPAISGNRIIFMDLAHIPVNQRDRQRENTVQEISLFTLDPGMFPLSMSAEAIPTITTQTAAPGATTTPQSAVLSPVNAFGSFLCVTFLIARRKRRYVR